MIDIIDLIVGETFIGHKLLEIHHIHTGLQYLLDDWTALIYLNHCLSVESFLLPTLESITSRL